jgi:hypothetical protein
MEILIILEYGGDEVNLLILYGQGIFLTVPYSTL